MFVVCVVDPCASVEWRIGCDTTPLALAALFVDCVVHPVPQSSQVLAATDPL